MQCNMLLFKVEDLHEVRGFDLILAGPWILQQPDASQLPRVIVVFEDGSLARFENPDAIVVPMDKLSLLEFLT